MLASLSLLLVPQLACSLVVHPAGAVAVRSIRMHAPLQRAPLQRAPISSPKMLAPLAPLLSGPLALPALTGLAALPCSLCYVRQAYVFSLSYGLATATIGTAILAALPATAQIARLHATLVTAYGVRLFGFLLWRQAFQKDSGWQQKIENLDKTPRLQRTPIILSTALFYALLCSPLLFAFQAPPLSGGLAQAVAYVGAGLALAGLNVEAIADQQKSLFKIKLREEGLFARSRHPNYFGEIVFWLGSFVMGLPALVRGPWWASLLRTLSASLGLYGIVFIMLSATKRLEGRQADAAPTFWPVLRNDGELDSYEAYLGRSGALIPKLF